MKLLRYFSNPDYWVASLKTSRFFASKISNFNDPFEGAFTLILEMSDDEFLKVWDHIPLGKQKPIRQFYNFYGNVKNAPRKILQGMKSKLVKTPSDYKSEFDKYNRLICFFEPKPDGSTDDRDVTMWANYADDHRGIRMLFDIPEKYGAHHLLRNIDYCLEPPRVRYADSLKPDEFFREELLKIYTTKFKPWENESEVRMFIPVERTISESRGSFYTFNPDWIKEIHFGFRCTAEDMTLNAAKAGGLDWVKFRQVYPETGEYRLSMRELPNSL